MPSRTILGTAIQNGETFTYSAIVRDESGNVINLQTALTAATITYYNKTALTDINSRLAQDIRGAGTGTNQHTLGTAGQLTWKAVVADTNLGLASDTAVVARYTLTYNDGASVSRTGVHEVDFTIQALPTVT